MIGEETHLSPADETLPAGIELGEALMNRFAAKAVVVVAMLGSGLLLDPVAAPAQPFGPAFTTPPPVPYVPPVPPSQVFAGGRYSFNDPNYPGFTYYAPGYVAPMFAQPRYLNPGPYYYTPTSPYAPSYYSYYYTPGYFRY